MKLIHLEPLDNRRNMAIIISATEPVSLEVTGADVEGLKDDDVIAYGSILITPQKRYVAYEDGVFTAQEG